MIISILRTSFFIIIFLSFKVFSIGQGYYFDNSEYVNILRDSLAHVKGYAFNVWTKEGASIIFESGGIARDENPPKYFDQNTTLTIGSTSKIITTAAVLRAIEKNPQLSLNDYMVKYFPYKWKGLLHSDFKTVTIRQLLQHRSGFDRTGDGEDIGNDEELLTRIKIQQPLGDKCTDLLFGNTFPCKVGEKAYSNFNMSIFQIILAYMIQPAEMQQIENMYSNMSATDYDKNILIKTSEIYFDYVMNDIMLPNDINAHCDPSKTLSLNAYMYHDKNDKIGYPLANTIYTSCAAGGWTMTVLDLSAFMHTLKYTNKIISPESYKLMENDVPSQSLGWYFYTYVLDYNFEIYFHHSGVQSEKHNGVWKYANAMAMNYPNGMQVSVLINSINPWKSLRDDLITAYKAASCPLVVHVPTTTQFKLQNVKAQQTIISEATVQIKPTEGVLFRAGKEIKLLPGFHAKPGSIFLAYIGECGDEPGLNVEPYGKIIPKENLDLSLQQDFQENALADLQKNKLTTDKIMVSPPAHFYPNPSTTQITLTYELKETSKINLEIFDLQNRKILSPIVNQTQLPGKYSKQINIEKLVPGTYIYRLQMGNIIETGKLIKQ